jgi:hypothetical protein
MCEIPALPSVPTMNSQTSLDAASFSDHPALHLTVLGVVVVVALVLLLLRRRSR